MAKILNNINKPIKPVKAVEFKPVGNLLSPKLPQYYYFGLMSGTSNYTESGEKICKTLGGFSYDLTDEVPVKKEYGFKNISNLNQDYTPFVNAYISGKINTIIENIKDYVRIEFPAEAQKIALKTGADREKAKTDFRNYVQNDLIREIVKATIAETDRAFTPTMTFLLNSSAILNIQYNYMLQTDAQENGGAASQMKQGVKDFISKNWYYYNISSGYAQNRCIDAINQRCQQILKENKQLYQTFYSYNNSKTSVIHYLNENLDELYKYIGSAIPISQGQTQQGADLEEELNFVQAKGNKKNSAIDKTTFLLLAIPIVAILLLKKKGK